MTLNQLRCFHTLARFGNYQRASKALFISEPSLSRTISSLERDLGVSLFEKQGRGIALTPAGKTFDAHVEQALSQLELGIAALKPYSEASGTIRIGTISPMLEGGLKYALPDDVLAGCGNPVMDIHISQTSLLLEGLEQRQFDLVFCSYSNLAQGVRFVPILEQHFLVAMRCDDPLALSEQICPKQLNGREMVTVHDPVYMSLIRLILDANGVQVSFRGTANEDTALMHMIESTGSVLICTHLMQTNDSAVVFRPLAETQVHRYIYAAWLPGHPRSSAMEKITAWLNGLALTEEGIQPKSSDRIG